MVNNWQDAEGRGRGLIWGAFTPFVWTDCGKSMSTFQYGGHTLDEKVGVGVGNICFL